jgi:starvation-inducible outer membrane lipoprotein
MIKLVSLFWVCLMIAACSSFPKKNQDPNKDNAVTFKKDLKECQEDYPELGSGIHVRQWESCMNLKGWK